VKKLLLVALPLLIILIGLPVLAGLIVSMSTTAAAECGTQTSQATSLADLADTHGQPPETDSSIDSTSDSTGDGVAAPAVHAAPMGAAPEVNDVIAQLMQLRFASNYPTITAEQARNAFEIAQVAHDVEIPRYGLQIAIATAIQESKLVNLTDGDRDSAGLFQQRPSQGWGSRDQVTNPDLAARAFFGQAHHTSNPGLLDIPGWQTMSLTQAAQAVQGSSHPDAYAQWEVVAGDITDLLGVDLADLPDDGSEDGTVLTSSDCRQDTLNSITLGTLNLLGAGHTDGKPGSGKDKPGYPGWEVRLPGAVAALEASGITIAGLQEVHGPQAKALADRYSVKWGMYPATGPTQNKVIWDRNSWEMTDARLIQIPYFGGHEVGMPLVQLTGIPGGANAGQVIWFWSIHNPADSRGNAIGYRSEALRRELSTLTEVAASGAPAVALGDFNDGRDGQNASHCVLTPSLTNAFGGSADPCKPPQGDARVDHIYGANLTWASASVDTSTQTNKVSDHPLVVATTASSSTGCAISADATETDYHLGPVKPQLVRLVNILAPMFDIEIVGGYRPDATDPNGHPAGLAADFMTSSRTQGDRLAEYAQAHASELGIDYIIWWQRIWSVARASEGWRPMEDRGNDTENHKDHVHINVKPGSTVQPAGLDGVACDEVVYPVPAEYIGTDQHNWHATGPYWSTWHTGTDFSVPCGTPVYAAHAGTIEIDTTQAWAGPQLVKVTTGAGALTTWYAHMEQVTVSRGETVQPGQQIGLAGQEGNVSGCHLHFEVHLQNGPIYGPDNVDPSVWLAEHASPPTQSA
jgi:hypothetical protein